MLRSFCFFLAWSVLAVCIPTQSLQAGIVLFNIQGKAGFGLLPGNENQTINGTPGSGGEVGAGISFDDVSNILTLNVGWGSGNGFSNLSGNVTAAHIHGPTVASGVASFTQNASVKYGLDGATVGFNNSATNGGWTNTTVNILPGDVAGLLAGQFYLNVHTAANTGGEIRGNLVAVPEPSSVALVALVGVPVVIARMRARRKSLAS
jgi:hypothetical protein